jgi:hypothetical protein
MKHFPFSVITVLLAVLLTGCAQIPIRESEIQARESVYRTMIYQAEITKDVDMRTQLEMCVRKWDSDGSKSKAHVELLEKAMVNKPFVVLESGNVGWGGYHYAFVWKDQDGGYLATNLVSDLAPEKRIPYRSDYYSR